MHKIYLDNVKSYCFIDSEDADLVAGFNWFAKDMKGYRSMIVRANRVNLHIMMHTLIAGACPKDEVWHINGNGLDNRKNNLILNGRRVFGQKSRSQYRGVTFDKETGKWRTVLSMGIGQPLRTFGRFDTEIEAAIRYDEVAERYLGEYARKNFEGGDAL